MFSECACYLYLISALHWDLVTSYISTASDSTPNPRISLEENQALNFFSLYTLLQIQHSKSSPILEINIIEMYLNTPVGLTQSHSQADAGCFWIFFCSLLLS